MANGKGISNVTMTDSGELYISIPTVRVSKPTAEKKPAVATAVMENKSVQSITIDSEGTYYTSAPGVTIDPATDSDSPVNWIKSYSGQSPKSGTYMYQLQHTSEDSDYTNFDSDANGYNEKIEFWLNIPAARTGDIIRFPGHEDSDGSAIRSAIRVEGNNLKWLYITASSGGTLTSSGNQLTPLAWHHVQLRTDDSGGHKMWIDGTVADYTDPGAEPRRLISGNVQMHNGVTVDGIMIDNFRYDRDSGTANTIFTPSNLPDSDRDTGTGRNYLGFELQSATATSTMTNGRITDITVTNKGSGYGKTPNITIGNPTGGPGNFTASLGVNLDSDTDKIKSLFITDSGDFYIEAPTITINEPISSKRFIIGETIEMDELPDGCILTGEVSAYSDSGEVISLIHVGSKEGDHFHEPTTGYFITGKTSGARGKITKATEKEDVQTQNKTFSTEIESFLDFTESNPFGEPAQSGDHEH